MSFVAARDLHLACLSRESVLPDVLGRVGFHGSLVDVNSNINSSRSYKIVVNKSSSTDTGNGNQQSMYSIAIQSSRKMSESQKTKLKQVFDKREKPGFLEWLGGIKGWRFDCPKTEQLVSWKRRFVVQLNTLQSVFTLFAMDEQKYFFVDEKKRMVWRKQNELTEVVSDIRVWLECMRSSSKLTRKLLRNSSTGPDHYYSLGSSSSCEYVLDGVGQNQLWFFDMFLTSLLCICSLFTRKLTIH